jgi:hypothetical protein
MRCSAPIAIALIALIGGLGLTIGACASVTGLNQYSNGCSTSCEDASAPVVDATSPSHPRDSALADVIEASRADAPVIDDAGPDVANSPDAMPSDEGDGGGCEGGGCQTTPSAAVGWACAKGGCNAAGGTCSQEQTCYCTNDSACKTGKCVKTTGQNDVSCTSCSGSSAADGFDCQLGSPGVAASCTSSTFSYTPSNLTAAQLSALAPVNAVDLSCSGTLTYNGSTWSGATCSQTLPAPKVVPQTGGPSIDVLAFKGLTIGSGVVLKLTGSNAVMIVVVGDATILGTIHADGAVGVSNSSNAGGSGPGGNYSCGSSKGGNGGGDHTSGGGGGGASSKGGSGASGVDGTAGAAGGAFAASAASPLRGGCPGGTSGSWACTTSGGGGGGAVQISAAGTLTVSGTITASGGTGGSSACTSTGCAPGPNRTYGGGAGGGGSGGTIALEGQTLTTTGSTLTPNGGAGGNPDPTLTEKGVGGAGGTSSARPGGDGTGSASGLCGSDDESGAGGGGGYGTVVSNMRSAAATSCFCVSDSQCSTGQCVSSGQCPTTDAGSSPCSGTGEPDPTNCVIITAAPTAFACPMGNCSDVATPAGTCNSAGVACWCTADSQCPGGSCVSWAGCNAGACTGTGTGDAFHCAP